MDFPVVGTCNSEYVGGTGSGSASCAVGEVFTSSSGAATVVDDDNCCEKTCNSEYIGGTGSGSIACSPGQVAEAPWSVAEWSVALRFDNPRATVLVLLLG